MWHPKKNLDPFLPVFSHFFMSYFDVLGSIFEKWPMTDLPNVIVSMCLVSYNFCMIPHVWALTFGLNLSGAWGAEWFVHARNLHQVTPLCYTLNIKFEVTFWINLNAHLYLLQAQTAVSTPPPTPPTSAPRGSPPTSPPTSGPTTLPEQSPRSPPGKPPTAASATPSTACWPSRHVRWGCRLLGR